jgi:excisionase family DNA binding protein
MPVKPERPISRAEISDVALSKVANLHPGSETNATAQEETVQSHNRRSMTVTEAAIVLGISRALAYQLVARNELPSIRLGRRIIIPRRAVDAMLGDTEAPSA